MSALVNAIKAVADLLQDAYPSTTVLLGPDDERVFQDFDYAGGDVVARYYTPQVLTTGGMATVLATVDVAAHTAQTSAIQAGKLLSTLGSTNRAPSGAIEPRTSTIRGAGYWRTNVQFTLLVDTLAT